MSAKSAAVASYGASTWLKPKESHAAWNFAQLLLEGVGSFWYDCTVAVLPLPNLAAQNCWYVSRGHVFCFFSSCVATMVAWVCGLGRWMFCQVRSHKSALGGRGKRRGVGRGSCENAVTLGFTIE